MPRVLFCCMISMAHFLNACQTSSQPSQLSELPTAPFANRNFPCYHWLQSKTPGQSVIVSWQHPELDIDLYHALVLIEDHPAGPLFALYDELGQSFLLSPSEHADQFGLNCAGSRANYCFWYVLPVDQEPRFEVQLRRHTAGIGIHRIQLTDQQRPSSFNRAVLVNHFYEKNYLEFDMESRLARLPSFQGEWLHFERCLSGT